MMAKEVGGGREQVERGCVLFVVFVVSNISDNNHLINGNHTLWLEPEEEREREWYKAKSSTYSDHESRTPRLPIYWVLPMCTTWDSKFWSLTHRPLRIFITHTRPQKIKVSLKESFLASGGGGGG